MTETIHLSLDYHGAIDDDGNTILHIAALLKSVQYTFKEMDERSMEVNAVNKAGETALFYAVLENSLSCVLCLLKYGADPNIAPINKTYPIHLAANSNNYNILRLLIDHGADVTRTDKHNKTALSSALEISSTHKIIIKFLIESGCPITDYDLYAVFRTGNLKKSRLIVERHLENESYMPIDAITQAFLIKSSLLDGIFTRIDRITYNPESVTFFFQHIAKFTLSHWRNLCKFDDFMVYIANHRLIYQLASSLIHIRPFNSEFIEIFYLLLEQNSKFNQFLFLDKYATGPEPIVHFLIYTGVLAKKAKNEIIKLSHDLISKGLTITITDVLVVHFVYGNCDFYRYLRDRCKVSTDNYLQYLNEIPYTKRFRVETRLVCDMLHTIDEILTIPINSPIVIESALEFTVLPIFIKHVRKLKQSKINQLLKQLPKVPSLKELTRNTIRDDLVRRYSLKGVADYCRIIRELPAPNEVKEILLFERKLYKLEDRTVYKMCDHAKIYEARKMYLCQIYHQ